METNNIEFEKYQNAKKRVEEIKGFYGHLTSFIIVNIFFIIINLKYSPEHLWFYWTTLGWGIGLILHGLKVLNSTPFLNKEWEEKKIKQFMDEDKSIKQKYK